jgi:hypothetical protein
MAQNIVSTAPMQMQLSTPVVGGGYTNLTGNSAALTVTESPADSPGNLKPNYPRLPARLESAKLKLSFLKRCLHLKRPPSSLRLKRTKSIQLKSFIKLASISETEILRTAIKEKRTEIDNMYGSSSGYQTSPFLKQTRARSRAFKRL